MKLRGIFAPITTPLSADGDSLALDHLKINFAAYNKTKLTGYVVGGSTGEAILLSSDETDRVLAAVTELAAPGKILVAGTGTESRVETIARTRLQSCAGPHATLLQAADDPHRAAGIFSRRSGCFSDSSSCLFHSTIHRRRSSGRTRGAPRRASQYLRYQGKLGQVVRGAGNYRCRAKTF